MQIIGSVVPSIALLATTILGALAALANSVPAAAQTVQRVRGGVVTLEVTGTWPVSSGLLLSGPPRARVNLLLSTTPTTVNWRGKTLLAGALSIPLTLDAAGESHIGIPAGTVGPELYAQMILMPTPLSLSSLQGLRGSWVSPVLKVRLDLGLVTELG